MFLDQTFSLILPDCVGQGLKSTSFNAVCSPSNRLGVGYINSFILILSNDSWVSIQI